MNMQERVNQLIEECIYLDEIAGQLDPETNARVDARRVAIKQQVEILDLLQKHDISSDDYMCIEDIANTYGLPVDAINAEIERIWQEITV